jgi:hypothetical protein
MAVRISGVLDLTSSEIESSLSYDFQGSGKVCAFPY